MSDLKAQLEISADASGVEAGVNKAKRSLADLGASAKAAGQEAAEGVASISQSSDASAKKLDSSTKSMIQSIERTIAVMQAGSRTNREYFEVRGAQRGIDPAALKPYLDQLEAVNAKQKAVQQAILSTDPAVKQLGVSAAQTAAALRNVPAQFTDIVVSLQAGQKPLTVLLQQGGQLKDMFGGVGNAAKAVGGYVLGLLNPYTLIAGAVAALALAYKQGSDEADAYSKALILSGNVSGETSDRLEASAKSISKVIGTQGAAAAVLAEMAGNGKIAADNLERFTIVALQMEKAVGKATSETVKELAELAKAPLSASEKLNEQYHYLTAAVYEQIKALQNQGKTDAAGEAAQKAYADAFSARAAKIIEGQGAIEKAWHGIANAAKSAWDSMLDIGRGNGVSGQLASVTDQIKIAQSHIAESSKQGGGLVDVGVANYYKSQLQDLLRQQEVLRGKSHWKMRPPKRRKSKLHRPRR
jgi:phage-related minor tail protein